LSGNAALIANFFVCINLFCKKAAYFVAVTILLAMSVYQVIVSNKLPSTSHSVPLIGQY